MVQRTMLDMARDWLVSTGVPARRWRATEVRSAINLSFPGGWGAFRRTVAAVHDGNR